MESLSVEDWEFARANITSWASDLTDGPNTKSLSDIRDKIYDLGKRIDILTRPPFLEPESPEAMDDAQAEDLASAGEEPEEEEEEETVPEEIENETMVSDLNVRNLSVS